YSQTSFPTRRSSDLIVNTLKEKYNIKDPLFNHRQLTAFVNQQAQFKNKENQKNFFYQQRYHAYFSEEASTVETLLTETERATLLDRKSTRLNSSHVS